MTFLHHEKIETEILWPDRPVQQREIICLEPSYKQTLKTMALYEFSYDGIMDAELCWIDSMSDYNMSCKSHESVTRDALVRMYAKRLGAGKGGRMTRAMKDKVEGMIDRDMQAEYNAYYIAKWEPTQLIPAFANHREVLSEITALGL